jgi:arylsulfatase A-like enzyme
MAVLHFFDVHNPYDPPQPFDKLYFPGDTLELSDWEINESDQLAHPEHLEHFLPRYDGGITWVDTQIGRLFAELRCSEYAAGTVIMVTADHGEEFLERGGIGHGANLYQEILHVTLFVSGPGIPSDKVITETAALYDILPTLLATCSIEDSSCFEGIDLLS